MADELERREAVPGKALQATSVMLTPLGGARYRLVFQNQRHYSAIEADAIVLRDLAGRVLDTLVGGYGKRRM